MAAQLRTFALLARRTAGVAPRRSGAMLLRSQPAGTMKPSENLSALERSKLMGRPMSPHLSIYEPQITWVMSGAFRVSAGVMTACIITGTSVYAFCGLDAATYIKYIEDLKLPWPVIAAGKFTVAAPMMFHIFNGIRHMVWDTTRFVTNPGVRGTGYVVLGLTAATSLLLSIM